MTTAYKCWKIKNDYVMALKSSEIFQSLKTEEVYELQGPSRTLNIQETHRAQETYEAGENNEAQEAQEGRRTHQASEILEPRGSHDPREPQVANEAQVTSEIFKPGEAGEASDNFSGRKKSKLQAFKDFFTKKKALPTFLRKNNLKTSQSNSDIAGFGVCHSLIHPGSKGKIGSKSLSHESIFMQDSGPEDSSDKYQDDSNEKSGTFQGSSVDQDQGTKSLSGTVVEGVSSAVASSQPVKPPDSATTSYVIPVDFSTAASALGCLDTSAARHKMALNPRKQKMKRNLQAARKEKEEKSPVPKAEEENSSGRKASGKQKGQYSKGPSVLDTSSVGKTYTEIVPDLVPRTSDTKRWGPLRAVGAGAISDQEKAGSSETSHPNIEIAVRPKVPPKQTIKESKASKAFHDLSREPISSSRYPRSKAVELPKPSPVQRRSSWDVPSCFPGLGKKSDTIPVECKQASLLKLFPDDKKDDDDDDDDDEFSIYERCSSTTAFESSTIMPFGTEKVSVIEKPKIESPFGLIHENKPVREYSEIPFILESEVPKSHFISWQNVFNENLYKEMDLPQSHREAESQACVPSLSEDSTSDSAEAGLLQKSDQASCNPSTSVKSVRFTVIPVMPKSMPEDSGSEEPLASTSSLPLKQEASDKAFQVKASGAQSDSSLTFQEPTDTESPFGVRLKRINSSLRLNRKKQDSSWLSSMMREDLKAEWPKKSEQETSDVTKKLDPVKEAFGKLQLENEEEKAGAAMPLEKATAAQSSADPSEPVWIMLAKQKQKGFQGHPLAKGLIFENKVGAEADNTDIEENTDSKVENQPRKNYISNTHKPEEASHMEVAVSATMVTPVEDEELCQMLQLSPTASASHPGSPWPRRKPKHGKK